MLELMQQVNNIKLDSLDTTLKIHELKFLLNSISIAANKNDLEGVRQYTQIALEKVGA